MKWFQDKDIDDMIDLKENGMSEHQLGVMYKVSKNTMKNILDAPDNYRESKREERLKITGARGCYTHTSLPQFCPVCRYTVEMPCRICEARKLRDKRKLSVL